MSNGQIFCRVEQKFPISADKRYRLERLIKDRIEPDKYPRGTICNLYFDTPDYLMIRNSIDAENYKEKLRLRSYGIPEDDGKVFLELKKKFFRPPRGYHRQTCRFAPIAGNFGKKFIE